MAWVVVDPPLLTGRGGALAMLVGRVLLERRAVQMPGGNTVTIVTIPHLLGIFSLRIRRVIAAATLGILVELRRLHERQSRVICNTANTNATMAIAAFAAARLEVRGTHLIDGGLDDVSVSSRSSPPTTWSTASCWLA